MRKGRPTKDPTGFKRVKIQPWVSPTTRQQIEILSRLWKCHVGEVLDRVYLERKADAVSKNADEYIKAFQRACPSPTVRQVWLYKAEMILADGSSDFIYISGTSVEQVARWIRTTTNHRFDSARFIKSITFIQDASYSATLA